MWLIDEANVRVAEQARLDRPLMSGGESAHVSLFVPDSGKAPLRVRAVRTWRDGRDKDLPDDVSEQVIDLT